MKPIKRKSELPPPGTYAQSFLYPEYINEGRTIVYGSGCYYGDNFILTTIFRDDLTKHDSNDPTHLNINRKFERILFSDVFYTTKVELIDGLNNTFWLPHRITW